MSAPGGSGPGGGLVEGCLLPGGSGPRGGCLLQGRGCLLPGGLVWGGLVGGVGYIPACSEADPLPPVDRQTPVKILPWSNFVAAGNK